MLRVFCLLYFEVAREKKCRLLSLISLRLRKSSNTSTQAWYSEPSPLGSIGSSGSFLGISSKDATNTSRKKELGWSLRGQGLVKVWG